MANLNWETISTVMNIILALLIIFQWFWDRSRERAVKNAVFAARRIILRIKDDLQAVAAIDVIDAALATVDARRPFKQWTMDMMNSIRQRSNQEEGGSLTPILPAPMSTKMLPELSSVPRRYSRKSVSYSPDTND